MVTLTVCIGNSDDRLSQHDWHLYWLNVRDAVVTDPDTREVHGEFLSAPSSRYQNACWVFEGELTDNLRNHLAFWASKYRQDSIAVSVGETVLVGGG
jgi:hypothetical protein